MWCCSCTPSRPCPCREWWECVVVCGGGSVCCGGGGCGSVWLWECVVVVGVFLVVCCVWWWEWWWECVVVVGVYGGGVWWWWECVWWECVWWCWCVCGGVSGGGGGSGTSEAPVTGPRWLLFRGGVQVETRLPAGFLRGVEAWIPEVAGVDLEGLLQQMTGQETPRDPKRPVLDIDVDGDRVQVYVE